MHLMWLVKSQVTLCPQIIRDLLTVSTKTTLNLEKNDCERFIVACSDASVTSRCPHRCATVYYT